jgi:hypothetical protein
MGKKEGVMSVRVIILVGMVFLAALTRLVPHPDNFAPMTAMALFAAAHFRSRLFALAAPLVALFVSDLGIEVLHRYGLMRSWGLYAGMWVNYAALALVTCLGFLFIDRRSVVKVAGTTLLGSLTFFWVTNFVAWAVWDLYPKTAAGLLACYVAGIPFFGWTLLGDVCYVTLFFGAFALAERRLPALAPKPAAA